MRIFSRKTKQPEDIVCSCCGKPIQGHLPALAFDAPAIWDDAFEGKTGNELGADFCIINAEFFFIRAVLKIPIIDTAETLDWGVWVSLGKKKFQRYRDIFGTKKELKEEPYFGWFASDLPTYADCSHIKTSVQLMGGGLRPEIQLDHTNSHRLCQEQHAGITLERAHELVKKLL